ncbi:Ig-like domain-containing protein [Streptomyces sp. NPDC020917]|uniref:L,D-transpeptidase n=1 Tax=Streptomyces sp. NPDC020917 TaxID=3365102 RepID=UPI0037A72479
MSRGRGGSRPARGQPGGDAGRRTADGMGFGADALPRGGGVVTGIVSTSARRTTGARTVLGALTAAVLLLAGACSGGSHPKGADAPKPPHDTFIGYFSPEDRSTVGTGMIISLRFNRHITDRPAVERGITVTSVPALPVAGHWFGDERLDLRPADFWPAGTRITLSLRLRGVQGAPHTYGTQSKDVAFLVGRDQRSTVDAVEHTMTVVRGGHLLRVLPVTVGSPEHTTYNGVMVIFDKYRVTRMNGRTVGFGGEYDIPDVPHAMRLTTSGTFVHGNYWSPPGVFGEDNVSHGCIGLQDLKGGGEDTPAGWFYDNSLIGDAVRVVDSDDRVVDPDNGLGGWNLSWPQWLAGSALH